MHLTHTQLSPCSSRIGKAQTQSCHPLTPTPPTPPRAKHIHMSHSTCTPLTKLISSTSPAQDNTRVPPIYAPTAQPYLPRNQNTDPTSALPLPSHPSSLAAYTHATKTTIHASQSPQQLHPQYRVPRQTYRQTKDYHRTTNTTQAHIPSSKSERNLIILQDNIN